jgi:hypothetical protein
MDRQRLLDAFPLAQTMMRDGIVLVGNGPERAAKCPFHPDRRPSMSVNVVKQTWYCQVCGIGGSVIDYIAQRQGMTIDDTLAKLSEEVPASSTTAADRSAAEPFRGGTPVATYVYRSAIGEEVFRVLRYEPKTFRQQKKVGNRWDWGMDGVERVLYRLPEILQETGKPIWINEGEKDVDNLVRYRQNATCNVGGAGKWMDGYTSALSGKDVIICGDNDDAGVLHVKAVIEALDGKVKRLRVVTLPKPYKDISDFLTQFGALDAGEAALNELVDKSAVMSQGSTIPIFSMADMEARYQEYTANIDQLGYSFSSWIPSLGRRVRRMVPGDIITFVAATGSGKTALLQNMFWRAAPMPSLLFEMELADTLTFERFVAGACRVPCDTVEESYRKKEPVPWRETGALNNIYVCPLSGLTVTRIEEIINRAELKMGVRPVLVGIDYAQLLNGKGKGRYEKVTDAMSELKSMAKNTGTIVAVASQIQRKGEDDDEEVGLYAGKDSGQIENTAGLHIGFWKDRQDTTLLHGRVNKNTKGQAGFRIRCNFDGARMIITERAEPTINN